MDNLQLKTPINECSFSKRTQSVLKSVDIEYLEELSNMYNTNYLLINLRRWRNAGRKTFMEIEDKIKAVKEYKNLSEDTIDSIIKYNRYRGDFINCDFAETFMVDTIVI